MVVSLEAYRWAKVASGKGESTMPMNESPPLRSRHHHRSLQLDRVAPQLPGKYLSLFAGVLGTVARDMHSGHEVLNMCRHHGLPLQWLY
jgi:hypothetical protein